MPAPKDPVKYLEFCKNISNRNKGKPSWNKGIPMRDSTKKIQSEKKRGIPSGFKGRKHTEEANDKNRKAHLGITRETPVSEYTRNLLSEMMTGEKNHRYGTHPSEYTLDLLSEARKGERNGNYKGGITPLCKQLRNCKKYTDIRSEMFKDNDYRDSFSGVRGGKLNLHHLIEFAYLIKIYNITTFEEGINCEALWNKKNFMVLSKESHMNGFHNDTHYELIIFNLPFYNQYG